MASCIQQHYLKSFEQPCIDKAPFSLCEPHLFASASQLQQTNRSKYRIKNQVSKQHNRVQCMYIFCSKWAELTKIVWKKTNSFLRPQLSGGQNTRGSANWIPKNRGITDSSPMFQMRALWVSQKGKNKSTISHSNLPGLEWGNRPYKPFFNALFASWNKVLLCAYCRNYSECEGRPKYWVKHWSPKEKQKLRCLILNIFY